MDLPDSGEILKKVQRLSMLLRWLACSCLPEEYLRFTAIDKKWAEASTFAVWWQRAEAFVLQSWVLFVLTKPSLHLSLHFDGIRLHRDRVAEFEGGVEACAKACSVHIAKETGFQVEIVEKRHYVLVALIESEATQEDAAVPELGTVLLETGNCTARSQSLAELARRCISLPRVYWHAPVYVG